MALGRLLSDVRALNAELPSVAKQLKDVTDTATSEEALQASESASRAAGQAAEATRRSNEAATAAAQAISAIPPVQGAEFRITADPTIGRLVDSAESDSEGAFGGRIGSSSGSGGAGGGGSFATPDARAVRRALVGQGNGVNGGLLNQQPQGGGRIQAITPQPPSQGERAIVNEIRNLRDAISQSMESNGVSVRMGSKS